MIDSYLGSNSSSAGTGELAIQEAIEEVPSWSMDKETKGGQLKQPLKINLRVYIKGKVMTIESTASSTHTYYYGCEHPTSSALSMNFWAKKSPALKPTKEVKALVNRG